MLANSPQISRLAGMTKLYAPLPSDQEMQMMELLAYPVEIETLPEWLLENLLLVAERHEAEVVRLQKQSPGLHY